MTKHYISLCVGVFVLLFVYKVSAQPNDNISLARFSYNRKAPIVWKDSLVQKQSDMAYYHISFSSPAGGRATGVLVVPAAKSRFAGVILQHSLPGCAMEYLPQAMYIARHGAVVLALDAPFARRAGNSLTYTKQDSIEQVQLIMDLQRATDILLARKDVDAKRVAFVGKSYGGMIGTLFAAVEPRIHCFALSSADGGLIAHCTGTGAASRDFRSLAEKQQQQWVSAMQSLEPLRYLKYIRGKNFLIQSGLQDTAVPFSNARALQMNLPETKKIIWYPANHDLNTQAYMDQISWLNLHIKTTPINEGDKNAPVSLPASHLSAAN